MADAKTRPTPASVEAFIAGIEHSGRREDAGALVTLLSSVTGEPAVMWGPSIIGFGTYHYRYDSGHQGDAPLVGFSPRKANLVFYLAAEEKDRGALLSRLGKHRTGAGCIYVNRLADISTDVLTEMAHLSVRTLKARYPT